MSEQTPNPLQNQVCIWRHNRKLYPGWLIAPHQTRDKIWLHTRNWLEQATGISNAWPEPHQLILWRELLWRIDVCLQIVPDEAIDSISKVTNHLKLDITRSKNPRKEIFPENEKWPKELILSTDEFREDWVACSLALLNSYRLLPDIEAFEGVVEELNSMEHLSQDQLSYISYQTCLRALSELDHNQILDLITKWPDQPEDPYWIVRKASVLLEIGDLATARSTAVDALQRIRQKCRSKQIDYWRLSREGWCLKFLRQIQGANRFLREMESIDEFNGHPPHAQLDRELESARCSPDAELQLLVERITGRLPPTKLTYRTTNPPDFDTGMVGETFNFAAHELATRFAPAINILMACDVTGAPPCIKNFHFFSSAGASALQWIRDEFPGIWAAFALRYSGIGIKEDVGSSELNKPDAIRRRTLERLPLQHIERLFSATMCQLERIVDIAKTDGTSGEEQTSNVEIFLLDPFFDVVTRFSLCLDDDRREQVLALALRLSQIPTLRQRLNFQRAISRLLQRIVPHLTVEQLNKRLFDLLIQFPLPLSDYDEWDYWPRIVAYIQAPNMPFLDRPDTEEFHAGIRTLIDAVSSEEIKVRTDAALRLLYLFNWKLLTDDEKKSYKQALWRKQDAYGLPKVTSDITKFLHLKWPADVREHAINGLIAWIRSGQVRDRFDSENKTSWPDPGRYLQSLLNLADYSQTQSETFAVLFNKSSREYILKAILEWWQRERGSFNQKAHQPKFFGNDISNRINLVLKVVFTCALGKDSLDEVNTSGLSIFLDEARSFRQIVPYSYPISAYLDQESQQVYWNELRVALWHSDADVANEALHACWRWQSSAGRLGLTPMPPSTFESLATIIGNLHGRLSCHACVVVFRLISEGHLKNENYDLTQLTNAVQSAVLKLGYDQEAHEAFVRAGFDEEMHVHYRRHLASLLVLLHEKKIPIELAAEKWLHQAREDRFVDVRHAANSAREIASS